MPYVPVSINGEFLLTLVFVSALPFIGPSPQNPEPDTLIGGPASQLDKCILIAILQ